VFFEGFVAVSSAHLLAHMFMNKGECYMQLKDYPQAAQEYRNCLEIPGSPAHDIVYMKLGRALLQDAKFQEVLCVL
jgi:tetratricopeptide (TPR) repeat protein